MSDNIGSAATGASQSTWRSVLFAEILSRAGKQVAAINAAGVVRAWVLGAALLVAGECRAFEVDGGPAIERAG